MDTAPIPPTTQTQASPSKPAFPKTVILFSLLTLILGLVLGFGTDRLLVKNDLNKAKNLPVSSDILHNKVIGGWRGVVEGTLVKKDAKSFTIESNGNQLTIGVHPQLTDFTEDENKTTPDSKIPPKIIKLTLDQIPIGSHLYGSVNITIAGTYLTGGPVTAGEFTVDRSPAK